MPGVLSSCCLIVCMCDVARLACVAAHLCQPSAFTAHCDLLRCRCGVLWQWRLLGGEAIQGCQPATGDTLGCGENTMGEGGVANGKEDIGIGKRMQKSTCALHRHMLMYTLFLLPVDLSVYLHIHPSHHFLSPLSLICLSPFYPLPLLPFASLSLPVPALTSTYHQSARPIRPHNRPCRRHAVWAAVAPQKPPRRCGL